MAEIVSQPICDYQVPGRGTQYAVVPSMDPSGKGLNYPKRNMLTTTGSFQMEHHSAEQTLSHKRKHEATDDNSNKRKIMQKNNFSNFSVRNSTTLPEKQLPLRIQIPGQSIFCLFLKLE